MEILINTPGQTFYYSSIEELLNYCEEKDNCAVIIFHTDVNDFIEKLNDKINPCVSQLIVIADNVNDVIAKTIDKNLLVISAVNIKDAIQIALNSSAMCKDVICVSSIESSKSFTDMVEMVIV
jgi:hypothetical protein